ncbi:MAG: hypothetical protein JKY43_00390 [Phycisphaerales bacterium]|nr:hypothetical protein [Phycisphaerales bacterium]
MRVHLVQFDIQWESPEANFERVRSLVDDCGTQAGDLIALPELFDSGFTLNTQHSCDSSGRTLAFLSKLAQDTGCFVHGSRSIMPAGSGRALNCATVMEPGMESGSTDPICEYYKIHPFSIGRELEAYQGGDELSRYTMGHGEDQIHICPAICYDLRFPELFRKGVAEGAEMFVLGANWPVARQHHWRTLLIARAIENQAFVLGINRCGDDPSLHYGGGTIAIGPKGEILGELDDQQGVLSVEIDPSLVHQWRRKFPAVDDIKIRSF